MPKRRWNPDTGEAHTFADNETPPANFLPCHPNDPQREAKVAAFKARQPQAEQPKDPDNDGGVTDMAGEMTKAQIIDALKAGGVEHDPSAKKAVLCDQLISALKKALTAQQIEFREDETADVLLAKVTKAQKQS